MFKVLRISVGFVSLLQTLEVCFSFQNVGYSYHGDILHHQKNEILLRKSSRYMASPSGGGGGEENYQNKVAEFLSNFLPGDNNNKEEEDLDDPLGDIDFNAPKLTTPLSLEELAEALDNELYEKEWFVTGKVNPIYFADSFQFRDPDVSIAGIEEYARGVYKLFDQETSRAEIISTVVNTTVPSTITCTWRLSGRVSIGPGLSIKPYIVYTDFTVDPETGLVIFQEDRFSIPGWDILLSAFFPFLVGKVTAPPADPVPPRKMSSTEDETSKGTKPSWWPL